MMKCWSVSSQGLAAKCAGVGVGASSAPPKGCLLVRIYTWNCQMWSAKKADFREGFPKFAPHTMPSHRLDL